MIGGPHGKHFTAECSVVQKDVDVASSLELHQLSFCCYSSIEALLDYSQAFIRHLFCSWSSKRVSLFHPTFSKRFRFLTRVQTTLTGCARYHFYERWTILRQWRQFPIKISALLLFVLLVAVPRPSPLSNTAFGISQEIIDPHMSHGQTVTRSIPGISVCYRVQYQMGVTFNTSK